MHLRIGRHEALQNPEHLVQLRGVGAEESEQMPEKEEARRERDEGLIRHLRRQTGRIVHERFPNETADDSAGEPEIFHLRASLLCRRQISIKLSL